MGLLIRYATIEDAKLIADISHQTFYETFAQGNTMENMHKFLNEQFTKGKLMMEVGARENVFLLAYDRHEVVGYAKLRDNRVPALLKPAQAMEVARLYALTHKIGKGVGAALMQKSVEVGLEKGKNVLWLGVWEKNQRAIDFYTKWGFEKFDEVDFLLGDEVQKDWLMRKWI